MVKTYPETVRRWDEVVYVIDIGSIARIRTNMSESQFEEILKGKYRKYSFFYEEGNELPPFRIRTDPGSTLFLLVSIEDHHNKSSLPFLTKHYR